MSSGGSPPPAMARRLGVTDAVAIGLGSMIGAGLFSAFAPAAAAAGSGLLIGLVIAAIVAYCNATASAQLAAQYPVSGGTYVYGRERLGEWAGFVAGWSFVIGKTASCAAMALTFGAYAVPDDAAKPAALAAVVVITAVNCAGVTRTAGLARVLVTVVLLVIVVVVVAGLAGDGRASDLSPSSIWNGGPDGWHGVLQSAGLLFFAFAGYARVATMGEEVVDPARTIPRAILLALGATLIVYAVVAVTLLVVLGPDDLARSVSPLADLAEAGGWSWLPTAVVVGASAASLGALLALVAGVGRTSLAMAREGDLPRWLDAVHPRHRVPHRAEMVLGLVVGVLVLTVDLRDAIGFSSFGVLLYYLVANLSAWTQDRDHRRYARGWQVLGAVGCAVLIATLPASAIVGGLAVVTIGVVLRLVRERF